MNQNYNQNQGTNVGKILAELRTQPANVGVITEGGAMAGDNGPLPNI